ncbi:unnamed protein product [Plutella xylostella]|nr:unnamed protein product [Plutella xylostella]
MPAGVRRVVRGDRAKPKDDCFVRQINRLLQFPWRPVKRFSQLHPALWANASRRDQLDYVMQQVLQTNYGVT